MARIYLIVKNARAQGCENFKGPKAGPGPLLRLDRFAHTSLLQSVAKFLGSIDQILDPLVTNFKMNPETVSGISEWKRHLTFLYVCRHEAILTKQSSFRHLMYTYRTPAINTE